MRLIDSSHKRDSLSSINTAVQETLEFDNGRELQSLYGNDLRLLKQLEERLHVRVTTRDGWIRFEGPEEDVERACDVFHQLHTARGRGMAIGRTEFDNAIRSVLGDLDQELQAFSETQINTSQRRPPVVAKTEGQLAYLQAIRSREIVFGVGPAGTGKTFLAVAMGIAALKTDKVNRLVLTRPAVEAGEALGFLPGDLQEKIYPYLRPLYDALQDMLEPEELQRWMERGIVEIAPLAYMRGRTLNKAFVILDEAQNTTCEQMFMFLTRLGQESQCVVTGDTTQIDLPVNRKSGLIEALAALRDVEGIAFNQFQDVDVVRHPLVQSIIRAYRMHRDGAAG